MIEINPLAGTLNPLAGTIMGSAQAQQSDIQRQVRRAKSLRKLLADHNDEAEHQVESSEEVTPIHDEDHKQFGKQGEHPHQHGPDDKEDTSRLDITA
jgi:hypothetical protein